MSLPERPLDVAVPTAGGTAAADYADLLSTNRAWQAIEHRYPGTVQAAAERMHGAREAGADDAAVRLAGQRVVEPIVADMLTQTSPAMRIHYLENLSLQLQAGRAQGDATCRAILAADAGISVRLPAPLAWGTVGWLVDAMAEPRGAIEHRRPSALELEVMRHSIGDRALAQLAALRPPPDSASHALGCDSAATLLATLGQLPTSERILATRFAFDPDWAH